jgi:hypothetical protein
MRPERGNDANIGRRRDGSDDRDDEWNVDSRGRDGDRSRAAAGAEASARMPAVAIGG